ncbi:MAG TPA: hypothetical protein V6C71_21790, partial [Coleofasciculaceae cyanobacterium]
MDIRELTKKVKESASKMTREEKIQLLKDVRGRAEDRSSTLPFKTVLATFTAHGYSWFFRYNLSFLFIPHKTALEG